MSKKIEADELRYKIEAKIASLIALSDQYAQTTKYADEAPILLGQVNLLRWVLKELENEQAV